MAEHTRWWAEVELRLAAFNPEHSRAGPSSLLEALRHQLDEFVALCDQEYADAFGNGNLGESDDAILANVDVALDLYHVAINFAYSEHSFAWNPPGQNRMPRPDLGKWATASIHYAPTTLYKIATEAIEAIPAAHDRLGDLLEHATSKKLDPKSANQLARLARLYLWGYDVEMRVMARTVLEAALMHVGEQVGIVQRDADTALDDPSLADLIRELGWTGRRMLDLTQTRIAHDIRKDANALVHNRIEHLHRYTNGAELLRDLSEVLNACMPEHPYTPPRDTA